MPQHPTSSYIFHLEQRQTPTGRMMIVTDDQDRLRAADWEDYEDRLQLLLRRHYGASAIEWRKRARLSAAARALDAYFAGDLAAVDTVATATNGTEFQRAVWAALREIPAGSTLSYGALAARLGRANAMRAVGLANGSNPIPVVVPCHRVIGADGSLTGFGGGLHRKRWLLAHEGAAVAELFDSMPETRPPLRARPVRRSRAAPGNRA
jgi:methylated-DNA-[protein]-cysteine S-methyltransferase